MTTRLLVWAFSIGAAAVMIGVLRLVLGPDLQEILLDSDSGWWPVNIHSFMWVALFIGVGEIILRSSSAAEEESQLRRGYLGDSDMLLIESDLAEIGRRVRKSKFRERCFLPRMIMRTVDQYQTNRQTSEASSILNSSLELYMHEIDLRYSMLRYIAWLIPSLGFIGTVMGIMFALQYAGDPQAAQQDDFLYEVTSRLGVAFTTTLLALVMSSVLVFLQSIVQAREERALNSAGQYCLDRLINQLGGDRKA